MNILFNVLVISVDVILKAKYRQTKIHAEELHERHEVCTVLEKLGNLNDQKWLECAKEDEEGIY